MEQTKFVNLPIIGRVQHGEKILTDNGKEKVVDYGYFIAKIQEKNMMPYLEKFNNLIKCKKSIDIQFINDTPFSIKRTRYNQSGSVCYCMNDSKMGKQKVKNLWKPIECNSSCTYLQKDKNGKQLCNKIGWLKFLIPEIATDRIWLMKVTGQQSIDNLYSYIQLQKILGNSLDGKYTIFLKKEEQTNYLGQIFNNYVLDILKKEDFISNTVNSKVSKGQEKKSKRSKNQNNDISNLNEVDSTIEDKTTIGNIDEKKQKVLSTTDNVEQKTKVEEQQNSQNDFENYYMLDSTKREIIVNKDGIPKEYLIAKSFNVQEKLCDVVIKAEDENEILGCAEGTVFEIEPKVVAEKIFALNINMIDKKLKEKVA